MVKGSWETWGKHERPVGLVANDLDGVFCAAVKAMFRVEDVDRKAGWFIEVISLWWRAWTACYIGCRNGNKLWWWLQLRFVHRFEKWSTGCDSPRRIRAGVPPGEESTKKIVPEVPLFLFIAAGNLDPLLLGSIPELFIRANLYGPVSLINFPADQ